MKKFLHILFFIALFIWQLPQCLIAILMMPFIGKMKLLSYKNYCYAFECSKMSGGISLGCFAFLSPISSKDEAKILHEQKGHVKQSHILSWLYLIIIGLPSILWASCYRLLGFTNYYQFYTEKWANKLANLETYKVYENYYLKIKK